MTTYDSYRAAFDDNGYIHIPGFITEAEAQEIEAQIQTYLRDVAPTRPKTEIMFDDYERPETLKRISNMGLLPFFEAMSNSPKLVDLAKTLLQDDVDVKGMQYFNKPPGGSETPAHQDGYYFCLVPNEALTLWLALDDVDDENGALHYIKGSHKVGILPHNPSQVIGFSQGLAAADLSAYGEEVVCPVKRGDLLVHHCRVIHLAGPNNSQRQRRVIGQVYFAQRAQVDPEMKRVYDEALDTQRKTAGII